jgi:hypothetical protein
VTHEGCNNTAALIKLVFASFVTTLPEKKRKNTHTQKKKKKKHKTLINNSKYTLIKTPKKFLVLCHVRILSKRKTKKHTPKHINKHTTYHPSKTLLLQLHVCPFFSEQQLLV